MHVAYSAVSGAYIPFYVGQAEGLFAQHGLDVDLSYIATGTVATNSMLTGELQMLGMGGPSTINAVMGGADLVMVGGLSQIAVGSIMVRDPDVQTLADLRGKRLAVSRIGSFIDTTTRRVLRLNNLVPDQDVAMVQAGGVPEIMAAVENGAADGGLLAPPITMEARRAGLQELLDVTALELPTAQSNVVVSRAYLESNRPAVKHFLLAIADAIALSQRDPLETKQVLAHYAGTTDPEALEEGYQLFAQRAMSHVPLVSPQAVAADLESIVAQDPRAANARVERFFDNSVVEELVHDGSIS
jgi:ABC-type nitrate/sulfonate/bicarbonate transport system substrate-binding protein